MAPSNDTSANDLKRRLATLSPAQRAALAGKLAAKEVEPATLRVRSWRSEMPPDADTFPASAGQQRLWLLDQILPDRAAYNIPRILRLKGAFDIDALRRSLDLLVARHEALRTRVVRSGDKTSPAPNQVIDPPSAASLRVIDLESVEEGSRHTRARELAEAEARTPFDLGQGPLFRALVLKLTQDEHWLVFNIHHGVSDGWSERVFCDELSLAYNAFAGGGIHEFPPLALRYADYALSQRDWMGSDAFQEQLAYWRRTLAGITRLELPTDRAGVADESLTGTSLTARIPAVLTNAIKEVSRKHGVTPFMTILSALLVLLHRHSGQDDIAIGTPTAGRNQSELEGLIGFFVSTVVVRTDLSGRPTFSELLGRVRDSVLSAYSHQDTPFEKIVEELAPPRDPGRSPFADVWVNMSPRASSSLRFTGVTAEDLPVPSPAKVALAVEIRARGADIELQLVYQTEKFSESRIKTLLEQSLLLLEQGTASPERRIAEYSLVTAESRRSLPDPAVEIAVRPQGLVATRVLDWAQREPSRIAVSTGDSERTYAELTERATTVAEGLGRAGIGRGDVVAIEAPRGFGVTAGMLGVLLAGAAFVTLDPALPEERKRVMLEESRAKVVLRTDRDMSSVDGMPATMTTEWVSPEVDPLDPAYVFFTSGSTGRPKAILGSHQGLSHFINWQRERFGIHQRDRVSQLIGLTFDPLLRDTFLPLTTGATLCVPTDEDLLSPVDWIARAGVTVVHTGPTVMQNWLREVDAPIAANALRWVFISGEPLTDQLIARWRQSVTGPAQLVNFYGPTETTMIRCYHVIGSEVPPGVQPIGVPLADSQALILNGSGGLCGIAETGEIVLRTPYRTLGYLNMPEENERRFKPNPFRDDEADLVYFTGDHGRYREDGLLEIAGRIDDQVKIRGVRVEPGEVSACLSRSSLVRQAEVIARKNEQGQHYLVSFVVPAHGVEPDAHAIRRFISERLPLAFVPGPVVFLDRLPALPNGKVDRKALAAWPLPTTELEKPAPPTDLLEVQLAHIWERVLGVGLVGAHDNFFDLGGHSLLAVRLFAEIEDSFGVRLPLATLFQAPTVRSLAAILRDKGWTPPWRSLVAIRPGGTRPPLFLVHGVGGNIVGFRHLAEQLDRDRPIFGLQSLGLDGSSEVCFTIEEMAGHYMREILSLQPKGPFHVGGMSFGGRVAFEVAQQLTRSGHEVGVLALLDASLKGYSDMMPFADRAREKAGWWKRRIEGHVREFRNANDLAVYARRKLKTARRKLRSREWRAVYQKHASKGEPLPTELVNVKEANYLASRRYSAKPYSGKVTLFIAEDKLASDARALRDAWAVMALGGVDVHEVPGNHVTLIEPPHVSVLARKLQDCLDRFETA
jgi:amino acid adenylation domain-containing protein